MEDLGEKLHTIGYFLLAGIGAWLFHLTVTNFILINFYSCTDLSFTFQMMPEGLKNIFNVGNELIIVNIFLLIFLLFFYLLLYGAIFVVGFIIFYMLEYLIKEALIHFHFLSEKTRNQTLENLVKEKRQSYLKANKDFVTSKIGFTMVSIISYLVGIYYFYDYGFMCNDLLI